MTTVRIAIATGSCAGVSEKVKPFSALVAYPYAKKFAQSADRKRVSTWVLDSGAFSAHKSGIVISHDAFIADALQWQKDDPKLVEVFALDVIGDPAASLKNAVTATKRGLNVIPCFHSGSPISDLKAIAKDFDKIAIGGAAMLNTGQKMRFAGQCFEAVWPKKIHGFAYAFAGALKTYPFHSVDSAVWLLQARRFRTIPGYGVCRGADTGDLLSIQIESVLRLERTARSRWAREMRLLEGKK